MSKNKSFKMPTFPRRFGHLTHKWAHLGSELLIGHVYIHQPVPKDVPQLYGFLQSVWFSQKW